MKTVKIFLCIAVFALTGICSGQLFSQNNSDVLYYTAYYNAASNTTAQYLNENSYRYASGDQFVAPLVRRTYYAPLGPDLLIEPWRARPIESNFYEKELEVESWMTSPFGNAYEEPELEVESWMTEPFGNSFNEPELIVESWMTKPF